MKNLAAFIVLVVWLAGSVGYNYAASDYDDWWTPEGIFWPAIVAFEAGKQLSREWHEPTKE